MHLILDLKESLALFLMQHTRLTSKPVTRNAGKHRTPRCTVKPAVTITQNLRLWVFLVWRRSPTLQFDRTYIFRARWCTSTFLHPFWKPLHIRRYTLLSKQLMQISWLCLDSQIGFDHLFSDLRKKSDLPAAWTKPLITTGMCVVAGLELNSVGVWPSGPGCLTSLVYNN